MSQKFTISFILKIIRNYFERIFWPNYSKINGKIFFIIFSTFALYLIFDHVPIFTAAGNAIEWAIGLGVDLEAPSLRDKFTNILILNLAGALILFSIFSAIITAIPLIRFNPILVKQKFIPNWFKIFLHNLIFVTTTYFIADGINLIRVKPNYPHVLSFLTGYAILYFLYALLYRPNIETSLR